MRRELPLSTVAGVPTLLALAVTDVVLDLPARAYGSLMGADLLEVRALVTGGAGNYDLQLWCGGAGPVAGYNLIWGSGAVAVGVPIRASDVLTVPLPKRFVALGPLRMRVTVPAPGVYSVLGAVVFDVAQGA